MARKRQRAPSEEVEENQSDDSDIIERIELPPKPLPKNPKKNGGIHAFTLDFVKDLKDLSPDRSWFQINRPRYDASKENFIDLVTFTLDQLSKVDPDLVNLTPKSTLFRINRDIRFSPNKNPYKTYLASSFGRGGKKSPFAFYYLHIESGQSIVAAGIYDPSSDVLAKIRAKIASDPDSLRMVLGNHELTQQ